MIEKERTQQQLLLDDWAANPGAKPSEERQETTESSAVVRPKRWTVPKRGTKEGALERLHRNLRLNPETGCMEWNSPLKKSKVKKNLTYAPPIRFFGRRELAHRAAYMLEVGPIPEGMVVRHKCDNPICCNPQHLELGTQKDNVHDTISRGRGGNWYTSKNRGRENGQAKLNEEMVRKIRSMWVFRKVTMKMIAKELGITKNAVANVMSGHVWSWVK
jgi:hypothetical protein